MLKKALRVAGISLEVLMAGSLVLAVLLFWVPRLFRISPYTVLSGSMGPVIRTEAGKIRTKGDANGAEDLAAVSRGNFLGKEVCSIPYLGYVTVFLQKKEGKAAAVVVAAVFFLAGLFEQVCRKEGKEYEKT